MPKRTLYIILASVLFIIGICHFGSLGSAGDMGGLIVFGAKVKLILLAGAFPFIVVFIYSSLEPRLKSLAAKITLFSFLGLIAIAGYIPICQSSGLKPLTYMKKDEYLTKEAQKIAGLKTEVMWQLNNAFLYSAPDSTLQKDKYAITKIIRSTFDSVRFPDTKTPEHLNKWYQKINNLLDLNYSVGTEDSVICRLKKTTETKYIMYGPYLKTFLAIATCKISFSFDAMYGHMVLVGQKRGGKYYVYAFTDCNQGGYGSCSTADGAMWFGLSHAFFYPRPNGDDHRYGLGRDILHLTLIENPPSIKFWSAPGLQKIFSYLHDTIVTYPAIRYPEGLIIQPRKALQPVYTID